MENQHWIEYRHPDYMAKVSEWQYTADHYDGARVLAALDTYLPKFQQGELELAWAERKRFADYTPYYALVVDEMVGMLTGQAKEPISREWGAFGDVNDPTSVAGMMSQNADGQGMNWDSVMNQVAASLINYREVWFLVEGVIRDAKGNTQSEPRVVAIEPQSVVNWIEQEGNLTQVLVREMRDVRQSIENKPEARESYVLYGLDGWSRWEKVEANSDKKGFVQVGSGTYQYFTNAQKTTKQLPIFRVRLALKRNVGYILSRKCNAIFNMESARDFLLISANRPRLKFAGSITEYRDAVTEIKKGHNLLFGKDHEYLSPPTEPAKLAGEVISEKVASFYRVAFKAYRDSAKGSQKTATEILQDNAGVEAFLAILAATLDEAENALGWRLEQVYFPTNTSNWGQFKVKRADQYRPIQESEWLSNIQDHFFGTEPIPVGATALKGIVMQVLDQQGIEANEKEIMQEIETMRAKTAQASGLAGQMGL